MCELNRTQCAARMAPVLIFTIIVIIVTSGLLLSEDCFPLEIQFEFRSELLIPDTIMVCRKFSGVSLTALLTEMKATHDLFI